MVNIATDSPGKNLTVHGLMGVDVQAVREKRARQRRRLRTRNTRRSRARLRKVARRAPRCQRDIVVVSSNGHREHKPTRFSRGVLTGYH
jgi:hypothetical protein